MNKKFSIFNFQFSTLLRGFTVIELITVMGVLMAVGSIVLGIFYTSLRSTKKASSINQVRQSGNYVISHMARTIRYALPSSLGIAPGCARTPPAGGANSLSVTGSDNAIYTYTCTASPSNLLVQVTPSGGPAGPQVSLIDIATLQVTACRMYCIQENSSVPPNIFISFTLSARNSAGLPENNAIVPFQTTVTLRNQ